MTLEQRIESNRIAGKKQGIGNVINHALVDIFGYEDSKSYRNECLKSARYETLLAIAGRNTKESYNILLKAVEKVANNPNTRAEFKL